MSQDLKPNQENNGEVVAVSDFLSEFTLKAQKKVPEGIIPTSEATQRILQEYFEIRPTVKGHQVAVLEVSKKTGISVAQVTIVLQKSAAQQEAKRQREEYADLIYSQKIPLAKSIVGKSLVEVDNFLTTFKPSNIAEAKDLVKIATDVTTLLRLELGQSTQQIEIIHKTHKDVTVILEELKQNDPFMDYEVSDGE